MKFLKRVLSLLLGLSILFGFYSIPNLIKISRVKCSSQFGPCSNFIEAGLSKYQVGNLRKVKSEVSDYLSSQDQIETYSIRFKLPSTLEVYLLEKKARFALFDENKKVYATVDEGGIVLAFFSETNLPVVSVQDLKLNTGEKVSSEVLTALLILERVHSAFGVKDGKLNGQSLIVALNEGYTVYFPLNRDPEELTGALSLILSALKGDGGVTKIDVGINPKTIDLRFKNPVLK